jgi:hypothetical protein
LISSARRSDSGHDRRGSGYLDVINGATGVLPSKYTYTSGGYPVVDLSISTV